MVGRRTAHLPWETTLQQRRSVRTDIALKLVLGLGGVVFLAACSSAANELMRSSAIGAVTLFWMAWSLSASLLALLLLKAPR